MMDDTGIKIPAYGYFFTLTLEPTHLEICLEDKQTHTHAHTHIHENQYGKNVFPIFLHLGKRYNKQCKYTYL